MVIDMSRKIKDVVKVTESFVTKTNGEKHRQLQLRIPTNLQAFFPYGQQFKVGWDGIRLTYAPIINTVAPDEARAGRETRGYNT